MERSLAFSNPGKATMASSSKSRITCANSYCRKETEVTRPGWESYGKKVPLCNQCFIAYTRKEYCHLYHKNSESWSSCKNCNKPQSSQVTMHESTPTPTPLASDQQTSVANNQMAAAAASDDDDDDEDDDDYIPEAVPGSTPPPMAFDLNESDSSTKAGPEIHPRNEPKMTDEELNAIVKGSNEEVIPLFEKKLSATDTAKGGRLVLPLKCAEKFFPSTDDGNSKRIVVQDFDGKDWHFGFKVWSPHKENKMYILEDFKDYVRSKKLREGDTVTFSKLVPGGKLVIGNRKVRRTRVSWKKHLGSTSSGKQVPKGRKRNLNTKNIEGSSVTKDKGKKPPSGRMPNVGSKRKTSETCSASKSAPDHQTMPPSGSEENGTEQQELRSYFRFLPFEFDLNKLPDSDE